MISISISISITVIILFYVCLLGETLKETFELPWRGSKVLRGRGREVGGDTV